MEIDIIGAPFHGGCRHYGPQLAPERLRMDGIAGCFAGHCVTDCGDVDYSEVTEEFGTMPMVVHAARLLRRPVAASLRAGHIPVILGGDHSISWGSIAGVLDVYPDADIVYIDAHGDFNSPEESPSGNIHGMHMYLLTEMERSPGYRPYFDHKTVAPGKLHFFATRSLDACERRLAHVHGLDITTSADIRKRGIEAVAHGLERLLAREDVRHVHLSFDVDGVDPRYAPGTGVPEPEGITPEEACTLVAAVARSGKMVSADLVEFNPLEDNAAGDTLRVFKQVAEVLGK